MSFFKSREYVEYANLAVRIMRKMRLSCFGIQMIILHFYFRMFPFSIQNVSGAAHQRFPIKVTFD